MESHRLDLGPVEAISGEAFGEPGQRTFRLLVRAGQGTLSLWLEKQHIVLLAEAIRQILVTTPKRSAGAPSGSFFAGELDVRVGSLQLGYDLETGRYVIEAADFESVFDLDVVSLQSDREQIEALLADLEGIVAAGRPRCTMCGAPLGPGPHFCPESNGHTRVTEA